MKTRKLSSAAAIFAVAVSLLAFSNSAVADTYQIFDLSGPNHLFGEIQGIDAEGNVVLHPFYSSTYFTFTYGRLVNTSNSLPDLVFDNGTPCPVPDGFLIAGRSVCNNGRTFFGGNRIGEYSAAYVGPVSDLTLLTHWHDIDQGVLNSSGDVVWRNLQTERVYMAINLTAHVPEPGSFVLLGTGSAVLFRGIRRKFNRS